MGQTLQMVKISPQSQNLMVTIQENHARYQDLQFLLWCKQQVWVQLLLPLKALTHRVPLHAFSDYSSLSTAFTSQCCNAFDEALIHCYRSKYP